MLFLAFKQFLNAEYGLSRTLLMQILSELWSIQKWARTQKSIRLYSSSLLIAYDARRLKATLSGKQSTNGSLTSLSNESKSPVINKTIDGTSTGDNLIFKKLQRCHSAQNNYDEVNEAIFSFTILYVDFYIFCLIEGPQNHPGKLCVYVG